jgi:hypothetical protein
MLIRPSYFSPPLLDESHGRRTSAAGSAAQELRSVTGRGCKPLPGGMLVRRASTATEMMAPAKGGSGGFGCSFLCWGCLNSLGHCDETEHARHEAMIAL